MTLVAWVPVAWVVTVAVHEFGHLLAGWAVGGRFVLFIVGPLRVQRTPEGVRLGMNWSWNVFGGMAACPPVDGHRLRERQAVVAAGGPLASVVLAVVAWQWVPEAGAPAVTTWGAYAAGSGGAVVAFLSGMAAVVTLWPSRGGGMRSDGAQILAGWRRSQESDDEAELLWLTVLALAGVRLRDWPEDTVRRLAGWTRTDAIGALGHYTAYSFFGDRGEWAAAQRALDETMVREGVMPGFMPGLVRAEYAWLMARVAGDAAAGRAWRESAGKIMFDPATERLAEAAVAAEGRGQEAAKIGRAGIEAWEKHSLGGMPSAWLRERLEELAAGGE